MPRWIAFDRTTFAKLRLQFPGERVFEHRARNAVDYAIGGPERVVAVLPLESGDGAGVAIFRRTPAQTKATTPARKEPAEPKPVTQSNQRPPLVTPMRAGGLLGLRDEAVYEEEPKPLQKKTWWRRFWPEDE